MTDPTEVAKIAERNAIVAWLRGFIEYGDPFGIHEDVADAIERGEHLERKP